DRAGGGKCHDVGNTENKGMSECTAHTAVGYCCSQYRGREQHHATEFVCECLRNFGIGEAPANNIVLTFAAAATSPWVDTESSVKPVNAVQARSEAARRHLKLDHVRKVALDRCCVLPAFIATAHFDVSEF